MNQKFIILHIYCTDLMLFAACVWLVIEVHCTNNAALGLFFVFFCFNYGKDDTLSDHFFEKQHLKYKIQPAL